MEWFLIGVLFGMPFATTFDKREECEGRAVILREKTFVGRCVPLSEHPPLNFGAVLPGMNYSVVGGSNLAGPPDYFIISGDQHNHVSIENGRAQP